MYPAPEVTKAERYNMTTETKTNGYTAETIQEMIKIVEKVAEKFFPFCKIQHFYYGDYVDMATIVLKPGEYAHFNICSDRVSLCGYTCSMENLRNFESMTYKDECYDGKLLELVK